MSDVGRGSRASAFMTPLGVLAGFTVSSEIILIAAIGTNRAVTDTQRSWLIALVFVLLLATLLTFYRLVTKHHKKLHAPFEYRTDEAFFFKH